MSHCLLGINFGERLGAFKIGYATLFLSSLPHHYSCTFITNISGMQPSNQTVVRGITCWADLKRMTGEKRVEDTIKKVKSV